MDSLMSRKNCTKSMECVDEEPKGKGPEILRMLFAQYLDLLLYEIITQSKHRFERGRYVKEVLDEICDRLPSRGRIRLRILLAINILRHCIISSPTASCSRPNPDANTMSVDSTRARHRNENGQNHPSSKEDNDIHEDDNLQLDMNHFDHDEWENSYNDMMDILNILQEQKDVTVLYPISRLKTPLWGSHHIGNSSKRGKDAVTNGSATAAQTTATIINEEDDESHLSTSWIVNEDSEEDEEKTNLESCRDKKNHVALEDSLLHELNDICRSIRIMQALSFFVREYVAEDEDRSSPHSVPSEYVESYNAFIHKNFDKNDPVKSTLLSILIDPSRVCKEPKPVQEVLTIIQASPKLFDLIIFQSRLESFLITLNNLLPLPELTVQNYRSPTFSATVSQGKMKPLVHKSEQFVMNKGSPGQAIIKQIHKAKRDHRSLAANDSTPLRQTNRITVRQTRASQSTTTPKQVISSSDDDSTIDRLEPHATINETMLTDDKKIRAQHNAGVVSEPTSNRARPRQLLTEIGEKSEEKGVAVQDLKEKRRKLKTNGLDPLEAICDIASTAAKPSHLCLSAPVMESRSASDSVSSIQSENMIHTETVIQPSEDLITSATSDTERKSNVESNPSAVSAIEPTDPQRKSGSMLYSSDKRRLPPVRFEDSDDECKGERKDSTNSESQSVRLKRTRIMFTDEEKTAIRNGVKEFGIGRWSVIKSNVKYRDALKIRSAVQIKDAYRTMLKHDDI